LFAEVEDRFPVVWEIFGEVKLGPFNLQSQRYKLVVKPVRKIV
jgi:hypothetical protein